ncbi:hypothetical protein BDV96DRAFT_567556 [Lophiotrema nucula]|uniref:Uncharacterized protein n=1 Tax=Lophiotrema nucula TaxID=690887 RepID=A0A6A5ZIK8_9PLEO|nr:hypothetical protein BDV96DRAFT_567556 [Lophiotrema nucula]
MASRSAIRIRLKDALHIKPYRSTHWASVAIGTSAVYPVAHALVAKDVVASFDARDSDGFVQIAMLLVERLLANSAVRMLFWVVPSK